MREEGQVGLPCRPHRQRKLPLSQAEAEDGNNPSLPPPMPRCSRSLAASSSSSSSSSYYSSSPSSPSSSSLSSSSSTSSSSSPFFTSSPSPSVSSPSSSQRRSNSAAQRGRSKPLREWPEHHLVKPFSEPAMLTMEDISGEEPDVERGSMASYSGYRRCMTDTDFNRIHGWPPQAAPDLLQLFNIFQFNKPEKPPARMLINVTLVGNIQPVRLLVAYDASVQDVIKASLKAYVKEGRLPRHCTQNHNYGLHYSPFCLENIDPTEHICSLGTRSFFLFPRVSQITSTTQSSNESKPWWNVFSLMLT